MQEKHVWKEGAVVTAEDIAASLKPLIDEYFVGECKAAGETLVYTLPDGKKFEISVTEKGNIAAGGCILHPPAAYFAKRFSRNVI